MPNLPGYYGISMTKYRPIISIYGKQVGNTYYSATWNTREQVVSFLPSLHVVNYLHCANLVIIITLNKWEIFYFLQNWYFAKDTWMLSFCHCHAQSSSPCTLCLARFFLYSLMSIDFPPSPPKLLVVSYSQVVHWNSIKVSYSYDFVHMVFLVSSFPPFCWTIFWSRFYIDSL